MKKIDIITCHDVYNAGASLQAFALQRYLQNMGYEVEIINYKPPYLCNQYSFTFIPSNSHFNRPLLKVPYLVLKFPGRLVKFCSHRKRAFDQFRTNYLHLTSIRYHNEKELEHNCPEADVYIAGSDQIWNPLFPNGKDPAFFLRFAPDEKKKISYAASFSVSTVEKDVLAKMQIWLKRLDKITVREKNGVSILNQMGLLGKQVCDPVFLISAPAWRSLVNPKKNTEEYVFVYDFDGSALIQSIARQISTSKKYKIYSFFPCCGADRILSGAGPLEFLEALEHATVVLSNSFHATAFSLILHRDFYVVNRKEQLNSRMHDLLDEFNLLDRLVYDKVSMDPTRIEWNRVDQKIEEWRKNSENFFKKELK